MRKIDKLKGHRIFSKKKNLISKVFLPVFIISLLLAGVINVTSVSATTWTGNGTTNGFCSNTSSNPNVTGQNWLFILTSPGTGPWNLTATFDPATTPSPIVVAGVQQGGGSIHFTVNTTVGAKLLSASATNGTANSVLTVSDCVVGRGTSTVTTTLHNAAHETVAVDGSVPLGTVMHDLATVTPSGTTAPTGSVTFTFFNNGTCTGDGTAAGVVALDGANPGIAHPSNSTAALTPGSYAFKASWPGDTKYSGNTSSCESFTVNKAQLGIGTTVHSDSPDQALVGNLALGAGAHDSASVTGKVGSFTLPDVTFYFFDKGVACTNGSTTGATQLNTLSPNGSGVAHPSTSETNLAAGTYNFMAVVAGNTNYDGATSDCEPFTVNKAQLSVTTNVHDASHTDKTNSTVPLGSIMHDTATVTGGVNGFALPAVSFTLTSNYTESCANGDAVANNGTEGGAVKSADSSALAAGSYAYRATVASNDNYTGGNSICEPFTVNKAQLTVTTDIHDANHQIVTNVPANSVVHDTATITGAVNGFATPAVTFTFYTNGTCTGEGTPVANTGADEGNAAVVRSAASAALTAGSYSYKGSVAGNDNYLGDDSDCEPLTVAGPTRTLGFWQTHFTFTNSIAGNFSSPLWIICAGGRTITTQGELYGGFYASIPKKSDGKTKRSDIDQARMQLMQQLLAAILNNLAFGGGGGSALITNAKTAYCTGTKAQILDYAGQLDAFNNSGDSQPAGQNTGSADPKASKAAANIPTWDTLP